MHTTLDWITLGIWIFVITVLVYGIIAIHDIPASIARKRNHPHTDAIEAAGWVSLFMLHALWPFLWIWAFYYKPGQTGESESGNKGLQSELETLKARVAELESTRDTASASSTNDLNEQEA